MSKEHNVTIFKLKQNHNWVAYAFTDSKSKVKEFKEQRNMDVFKIETLKMDDKEYCEFSYMYKSILLDTYLEFIIEGVSIKFISTRAEELYYLNRLEEISHELGSIAETLLEYPISKKLRKTILDSTNIINKQKASVDGTFDLIEEIDTFNVFVDACKNTIC